ncbi:DNA (cytosine-5-)-methyltransferase [uncultured Frigoribacterium sp.]|uniref:DNA (cytosine-5-)-methyltransferase n=1 Tax=uncultured Frigoribacterium sp. TaxID=335377 RepID=UPI0028D3433C|nr:DNA (cytosine-5-)-methyltransferase [uncultured Frigoribacterium sp.]
MSSVVPKFRFIDLFAGLGGFHVALAGLGGKAVFAAEWEPTLNSLYERNFHIKPWGDVSKLATPQLIAEAIPDHDVLTAGFPCQPFSKAGEQLGFEHTLQGQLFFKVFDILKVKRPRNFILENVPNILKHRGGLTRDTMVRMLEDELGYSVAIRRLSPHQFGVPQIRDRAYFVGSLDGLSDFAWPSEDTEATDIASVIDVGTPIVRPILSQTQRAIDMWDDFLRRSGEVKLPSFPIWSMEFGATYPYEGATPAALWDELGAVGLAGKRGSFGLKLDGLAIEKQYLRIPSHARRVGDLAFPTWKRTFIRQNRDFFNSNRNWLQPWMDKWHPWDMPSSLQKFEWNAQGEERSIDNFVIQVRASGIRVKRTNTAPSLIAMTHTQVPILGSAIAGNRRYMTPRECAALQSLDGIELPESDLSAYKALGNAVNAHVVRVIAEPLLAALTNNEVQPDQSLAA